mmetsp:Transcript_34152/g.82574  ORF Transcript_34152/g.82574 Transcript_34152/m.82574 type:complete len:95 (+) Transcript_34152:196-480(+)|eukprot:CAMPEP_0181096772 /NCGR_PEP_ID=MMETSP1071-20121207/11210_1 /TAXON_ID=35127 /ORGANISM="Thalassiosira sp., Strain NH16" /LENGTH=94 /DNA_ID=CAMNT_0023179201 /DNA_START=137 /DNA_END=421 /DNA_ORIENTATION=-
MVYEVRHMVAFLEKCKEIVGQEGPFYLSPQVNDPPPNDKFAMGESGRAITWEDILATFKAVGCNHELSHNQGRYFFEGFFLRNDKKTLYLSWGS